MSRNVDVGLVRACVLERPLDGELLYVRGRNGHERDIDAPDTRHDGFFVLGDGSAAIAIHEPKTVIERDQISDGAFRDHAFIAANAARANACELRSLFLSGWSSRRAQRSVECFCYIRRRIAVAAENRFYREAFEAQDLAATPRHRLHL